MKVIGHNSYERISGSTIGGATYLGLCQLLTNLESFDEVREVEKEGRNSAVDLCVRDIYGEESTYKSLGLSGDIIAASFGKVSKEAANASSDGSSQYAPEDITNSLLIMICNTLGQLAYLNASIAKVNAVYFSGGFLREKEYVWSKLQYSLNYFSKVGDA